MKRVDRIKKPAEQRRCPGMHPCGDRQQTPANGQEYGIRKLEPACQRRHKANQRQQPGQAKDKRTNFH